MAVIGAGSGIGRAVAAAAARETAEQIVADGGGAEHAALDITDADATDRVLAQFAAATGSTAWPARRASTCARS